MEILHIILILSTFLCSLVAGFLFAFAVVVMPGIRKLNDREFIRAFQVIDGVIQNNQLVFILVWVGSVLALITVTALGIGQLDGIDLWLLIVAAFIYLFGVQLPTMVINVPLNNKLQSLNVDTLSEKDRKLAREEFEPRWNKWNSIRTILSGLTLALMIILLLML